MSSPAARRETVLVLVLGVATMVVSMMQTLVVPILGLIGHDLHASTSEVSWVTTATLLSAAVFTPLLGRLGDQYGKKPTLLAVLVVMVAGSVLAALTHSLGWLIVARVLQGAATAIFPLALSVVREHLRPERLPGAMALISGTLAFGGGLALVTTGLLTQGADADFHRVFWLSAGLAVLALLAVAAIVPSGGHRSGGRVDVWGALSLAGVLVALLLPISQGHGWGWASARTLGCFAAAAVLAVVWVLIERSVAEPLVDLRMFTHRPVFFTNLAGILVGFGMFTQSIGISYLVQMPTALAGYGFGASVLRASVEYLLPAAVASLLAAQLGGVLLRRIGARATLVAGAALGAGGFAWLAVTHTRPASVIAAGAVIGAGVALGYAAMPALIMASVPHHQSGIANGINSISRSTGSAIGSATVTSLLAAASVPGLPPGVPPLPAESQFTLSFVLAGAAFAVLIVITLTGLRRHPQTPATPAAPAIPATDPIHPDPAPVAAAR
ncbi:transporter [Actinoplanes sp. SE50]|uniref:MFS transporter n=1 Tax=unclassified Actinoplanes TaxID=2626549 RepID=UPI00023EC33D|nr:MULTISPECIES: MFS transporter [unclassified Actinoplanes]AEV86987.1 major facilitator transporter [Actinoplanes sp. SE50/110]ATO85383.1 transporter [Actinoplanes sp. SE50]SLM02795.1 transporter [Actinoplanes sp. SE50/110]